MYVFEYNGLKTAAGNEQEQESLFGLQPKRLINQREDGALIQGPFSKRRLQHPVCIRTFTKSTSDLNFSTFRSVSRAEASNFGGGRVAFCFFYLLNCTFIT